MAGKLLEGKNAVVTGACGGIGSAIVEAFVRQGANVWALDVALQDEFADRFEIGEGQWVKAVAIDLSDDDSIASAFKEVRSTKAVVDVLVNCAGVMDTALFQMTTAASLARQIQINFTGAFRLMQLVSKVMVRAKSGSIVNLASTVGIDATEGKAAYGASKAALEAMTRSVAKELGRFGIRANCVAPSAVDTGMLDGTSDEALQAVVDACALGRIARPEEIASVVLFLASDMSSYVSGQTIRVDGGM